MNMRRAIEVTKTPTGENVSFGPDDHALAFVRHREVE